MPCKDAHLSLCQKGKLMAFIWVLISKQCAGPSARQPLPPLLQARPCYHHLTKFNRVLQLRTASTCSMLGYHCDHHAILQLRHAADWRSFQTGSQPKRVPIVPGCMFMMTGHVLVYSCIGSRVHAHVNCRDWGSPTRRYDLHTASTGGRR